MTRKKNWTAEEELRRGSKNHHYKNAMDEARVLLRWAQRRRFKTVQQSLERIIAKLDPPPGTTRPTCPFL
jgi:hypothetical protein